MEYVGEIARRAHVSVETVLRVLNGDPASDEMRARVAEAMEALGVPRQPPASVPPAPSVSASELRGLREDLAETLQRAVVELAATQGDRVERVVQETVKRALDPLADQFEQLGSQLDGELKAIQRKLDEDRNERTADLARFVEVFSTAWQTINARLDRIEAIVEADDVREWPAPPHMPRG